MLPSYGTAGTAPVKNAAILVEGAPRDATASTKTQGCWLGASRGAFGVDVEGAVGVDVEGAVGVRVEAEIGRVPTSINSVRGWRAKQAHRDMILWCT